MTARRTIRAGAQSYLDTEVADLIRRSAEANAALMRGDVDRYWTMVRPAEDFTLMSPFGGTPTRGSDYTPERIEAMGRFFRNGTLHQEVIQAYGSTEERAAIREEGR